MATVDQFGVAERPKPGIPCIESRQLANALSNAEQDTFSYEELSAIIQADVRDKARGYLLTAREIVLREKGYVFRPMRNIGIRRLTQREVAMLDDRFTHVRRTHKKTLREIGTVDMAGLKPEERATCAAKIALAHITVHTHKPTLLKALESAAAGKFQLDLNQTLAIFSADGKAKAS